ncbi:beta-ketoacyl-ACP synthase I [Spiribacter vilamensis]|uniref:3-oxoacyl-[acyl-carrier-protein] synthase 1 n=1 Tax=Spiribacter vilamensis TaxID=531306 RepID=A0A4Q8D033_9GAMM|nr:beta-ketoacyl-ACP synthase I [Spiribacter vilamensis]RZU98560.1 3-oxoacyl-[acyl-carrier-protein] synthase-1 [Spiribacter vilamensis]TVO60180.1 beta-ketoacyl-ACP synthase I [Spiribacter vilamensis]
MRRVVVTGMGIVSCLGNDAASVTDALRDGRSGIRYNDEYAERGLRSRVSGRPDIDLEAAIPRRARRFMADAAAYAYVAMQQAIDQAELPPEAISDPRTGLIAGSGGASTENVVRAADILRERGVRKIGAFAVPKVMGSTISACLATPFAIKGINYSISSACATSAHCIGAAMEQIQLGKQDVMFAGGGEEEHWSLTMLFDAMGALSTGYNDTPERASRPFDRDRDGFVIAGGGGMLVLESLEHAEARGAPIIAELVGYAATSDGYDMVAPSGEGAERCLAQTLEMAGVDADNPVDYVNAHGTSTPAGDITELRALESVFGDTRPPVSSTKSLTGHSLGAAGVQEAIYSLLMMQEGFIAGTLNVDNLDPDAGDYPIVTRTRTGQSLDLVVSNSFGFGGTNATLAFRRYSH